MKSPIKAAVTGLVLLLSLQLQLPLVADLERPQSSRFDKAIAKFLEEDAKVRRAPGGIRFIGSSSIRMWDPAKAFPDDPIINRGFGGSWIQDTIHFADKILFPYKPSKVVLYAGDNDVNGGLKADAVYADYLKLATLIHEKLPETQILFIAIKPSIKRWALWPEMKRANDLIAKRCHDHPKEQFADMAPLLLDKEGKPDPKYFIKDGLHLSQAGYAKWNAYLAPKLKSVTLTK